MADKKIAASLVNVIKFDIDRASMQRAMKAIKDVKKAMEGVYKPFIDAQKHMKKAQAIQAKSLKQKSDSLIVQKALDKRETAQLKQAEKLANIKIKQAAAEKKRHQEARKNAIAGLTGSGGSKASGTALADLLRQEDAAYRARRKSVLDARASANKARQQRKNMEMGLMHSEGLYMNRMFDKQQKQSAAANNKADKFTSRRDADQFFFRSKFGRGGERRFNQLAQAFSAGGMSPQMYASKLRILRSELYANQRAQRGFNQSIRDMRSAFVAATASYTAFAGVMGAAKIGQQYESRYAGMLVGTGSAEAAQKQISYLDKEVYRLGLDIQVASQGLVQMSVAAKDVLTQGQIQDLFTGLGELSTAVKLDPFRYEKAIMAISQMLNKGQLMAEEVKSQLGEQLPGSLEAIRRAASAFFGKDISISELFDLMKQGKLLAKDILPLLGKEFSAMARTGGALDVALNSLNTTSQRMSTSFRELVNRIYQGGLAEALSSLYKTLDKMFYFSDGSGFGKVFLGFFKELENTMWNIWDIGQILGYYFRTTFGSGDGELLGKMAYWTALFGILGKISGLFKIILGNKNLSGFKGLVAGVGKVGLFASAAALGSTGSDSLVSQGGDMALMIGSMFGPWGLAIGAFVKAGTLVYENWDTVTKWWQDLDIKGVFQNFIESVMKTFGVDPEKNRSIFAGATGSISGAGFNAAWANSLPLFMQNKDQKVEVQNKVYIDGKEIKTVAEEVVNTSMQRQTQSILPTYLNPASAGTK